jgi:Protein of unknown function (DUF2983).
MSAGFHGSYLPEDVTFLLKPISLPLLPVAEKERRIQSGDYHYSEMLSPEQPPSQRYLDLFHLAMRRGCGRFARHVSLLAKAVNEQIGGPVTLVSLARAGTPVGVLLRRELHDRYGRDVRHYSVSIIRDRGIDENALLHIIGPEKRTQESIVFVDGWTGKGVISRELDKAVAGFNRRHGTKISSSLFVVADLCGAAHTAATCEDYLIPSSVLNGPISGLVSRSVLNRDHIGPEDFHGCVYFREFAEQDLSVWFIDTVMEAMRSPGEADKDAGPVPTREVLAALRKTSTGFIEKTMERYGVLTENYVKPGIGEATRVLLRRTPHLLLLRNRDDPDVRHLLLLAEEKQVPVSLDEGLPYKAAALIRNLRL